MILKIADRIKDLRETKGLTQAEFARFLGVSRASVNAWEMGISTPTVDRIVDIAQFFHVSTDYLFGIENQIFIDISSLNQDEKELVNRLLLYFDKSNPTAPMPSDN